MGWDMLLYVIDEGVGHDPLKVCKQLDYEPDEADKPDMDQKIDNNSHETVCPKCLWYLARYKENPGYVKDKMHIGIHTRIQSLMHTIGPCGVNGA